MNSRISKAVIALMWVLAASPAAADEGRQRILVGGGLTWTATSYPDVYHPGFMFGGGATFRVTPRVEV